HFPRRRSLRNPFRLLGPARYRRQRPDQLRFFPHPHRRRKSNRHPYLRHNRPHPMKEKFGFWIPNRGLGNSSSPENSFSSDHSQAKSKISNLKFKIPNAFSLIE